MNTRNEDSPGMSPGQAVEDGAHERTSSASDTDESAGPGPGDGVESSPARDLTPEQARSVLAALAEEGLTVDRDGFVVPMEPADFGVVPGCEVDGCEGEAEVLDGERIVCREHAPKVDTETLALPGVCTCGGKMWCEACQDAVVAAFPLVPPTIETAGPRTRALLEACDVPPSTWLPPGPDDAFLDWFFVEMPEPVRQAIPDPCVELRRMGREAREEPLSPEDEAMIERIVERITPKRGEEP